jgi:hypothetical protein
MKDRLSQLTLDAIQAEAMRAHIKHRDHSQFNPNMHPGERLAILMEEVGEVARCHTYDQNPVNLELELIQVAAVAATWVEALNPHTPVSTDADDDVSVWVSPRRIFGE